MNKYYRLYCTQNNVYMSTGYNAKGLTELFDQYKSYKSNDWDEETQEVWDRMSIEDKYAFIEGDEFEIETSDTEFEELNRTR